MKKAFIVFVLIVSTFLLVSCKSDTDIIIDKLDTIFEKLRTEDPEAKEIVEAKYIYAEANVTISDNFKMDITAFAVYITYKTTFDATRYAIASYSTASQFVTDDAIMLFIYESEDLFNASYEESHDSMKNGNEEGGAKIKTFKEGKLTDKQIKKAWDAK